MGTRAWNDSGEVSQFRWVLLGAARKAFLHYGDLVKALSKITLNGMTYDIKKQAKEGLVTITEGYTALTFFLPENREPMTAEQGQSLNIKTYFQMMGETDYAEIPAWNYFVGLIRDLANSLEDPQQTFSYTLDGGGGEISGGLSLYEVTTFKQLSQRIAESIDADFFTDAQVPLSEWMLEDGTVYFRLDIELPTKPGESELLPFKMEVGRK